MSTSILTLLVAYAGLALGMWNTFCQWQDRRKKLDDELPKATLRFDGPEAPEDSSHSVRHLALDFTNPTDHRWVVDRVELVQPRDGKLRSKKSEDLAWGKQIVVSWTITGSQEPGGGISRGAILLRFPRLPPPADGSSGPQRVVEVRAFAKELGGDKRQKTISAHHVQFF